MGRDKKTHQKKGYTITVYPELHQIVKEFVKEINLDHEVKTFKNELIKAKKQNN